MSISELVIGPFKGAEYTKKFGYYPSISGTSEPVWDVGGAYPYMASPTYPVISSDDVNDTVGGTGAHSFSFSGLLEDWTPNSETIALAGQTAVTAASKYIRIYRGGVVSAGSGNTAAGNVYIGSGSMNAGVPDVSYAKVVTGNNQTLMCIYPIPAGKRGYIVDYKGTVGKAKETILDFFARPFGEVFKLKNRMFLYQNNGDGGQVIPNIFDEKTDVEVRAQNTDAGNIEVAAWFDVVLVDKD